MMRANESAGLPHRILVVLGSTRAERICPQVARWVMDAISKAVPLACEIVDLRDWHLPTTDEPGIPARDSYVQAHTHAWSRKVGEARGFIFVTPQYNWGYPAPLKNALDHLYKEWHGKPAMIVSYGFHGGDKCAAQLRQVLESLHMRPTSMPALTLTPAMFDSYGGLADPARDFASAISAVEAAIGELTAMLAATSAAAGV